MSNTPDAAAIIREAMRARIFDVRTAIPAQVESYDLATQTIEAKPMVKDVYVDADGKRIVEELPNMSGVPVGYIRGGGAFVSLPLAKGDFVQLLVNDRDVAGWRAKGKLSEPDDVRTHDLSNAIALPMGYPDTMTLADAHAENVVVGFDGGAQIHIKPNGEVHLSEEDAADFVALAADVKAEITALRNTVNSLVTAYNAHTHTGTTVSSCTAGGAAGTCVVTSTPSQGTAPATVGDVKATKVKAT